MKEFKDFSESFRIGILLAFAGGFMDAYSYICRDGVFANAQTGNIILLGINISEGNFNVAIRYLFPIVAFILGIVITNLIKYKFSKKFIHWKQISVLVEAIALGIVAFMPQNLNLFANSITSFACAIQVESFRTIRGNGVATTMCIGNLRSATENLCNYIKTKESSKIINGLIYYSIILFFIIGAISGKYFIKLFNEKAILICSTIHILIFIILQFLNGYKSINNFNKAP